MSIWKWVNLVLLLYYPIWVLSTITSRVVLPRTIRSMVDLAMVFWGIHAASFGTGYGTLIGVAVGMSYMPLMAALTVPASTDWRSFEFRIGGWGQSILGRFHDYMPSAISCLREELVWRSAFVFSMEALEVPNIATIVAGSTLFYLLHWRGQKRIVILTEVELFLFCTLLFILYLSTMSVLVTWIVHFVRNSYLAFHRKTGEDHG
jgi:hypothetical protein